MNPCLLLIYFENEEEKICSKEKTWKFKSRCSVKKKERILQAYRRAERAVQRSQKALPGRIWEANVVFDEATIITMMEELELDHERAKDQEEEKEQEEEVVVVEIPKPSKKPTDKGKEKKKKEVQFKLTAFFKKK